MLPETFTPDFLRQLELLRIKARRAFLGTRQGGHVSPKRGHGIEFADYRKYELGDNPRHIDWGVYARSDRLYVRKYQEEQDLKVFMLLDASASMLNPAADHKWEMARDIALALSYVALMAQDSVQVFVPGAFSGPVCYGGRAIHSLAGSLMKLNLKQGADFQGGIRSSLARVRFPGVALVISDFLMPLDRIFEIFNILRARNMEVTAVQVLGAGDIEPLRGMETARAIDSESGESVDLNMGETFLAEYGMLLADHNYRLRSFLAESQISYVRALSSQSVPEFVMEHLSSTGLLR